MRQGAAHALAVPQDRRVLALGAPVEVRRHPNARRLTLRVSQTRRAVIVTMPAGVHLDEAIKRSRLHELRRRGHTPGRPHILAENREAAELDAVLKELYPSSAERARPRERGARKRDRSAARRHTP